MKYKKGDTVSIMMEGFMGIEFPANAVKNLLKQKEDISVNLAEIILKN